MIGITKNEKEGNPHRGFTILYAILITTTVLAIGLSLLSVLVQQVSLSGAERESVLSFYVSDSGMECSLYWDIVKNAFRSGADISCDGTDLGVIASTTVPLSPPEPGFIGERYAFDAMFPHGCANIVVLKAVEIATNNVATTTVESRGYNTVCPPAASLKPWRLERGLQTVY